MGKRSTRTGAVALRGRVVGHTVYVFVRRSRRLRSVSFYLDGGRTRLRSRRGALRLDTTRLAEGPHVLRAAAANRVIAAAHFTVENRPAANAADAAPARAAPARDTSPPGVGAANSGSATCPYGDESSWGSVEVAHGDVNFKIWYPLDSHRSDDANYLAAQLDLRLWREERGLMGGVEPNRGDTLNICLVPSLTGGEAGLTQGEKAISHFGRFGYSHVFIPFVFNGRALTRNDLRDSLAHEFFHVLQNTVSGAQGVNNPTQKWWREASATWAIDKEYPGDNLEWDARLDLNGDHGLALPADSLLWNYSDGFFSDNNNGQYSIDKAEDFEAYGAYLLPEYLAKTYGDKVVGAIWQEIASGTGVDQAIANVVALREDWPKFIQQNWIEQPFNKFKDWDGVKSQVGVSGLEQAGKLTRVPVPINDAGGGLPPEHLALPHLSGAFFDREFTPGSRTQVFFNHPPFGGEGDDQNDIDPDADVTVASFIGGAQDAEVKDLSKEQKEGIANCASLSAPIDRMLLVFANSSATKDFAKPDDESSPRVRSTNMGCQSWSGSIHMNNKLDIGGNVNEHSDVTGVTFTPPHPLVPGAQYEATAGSVHWTLSGTDGAGCGWSAPAQNRPVSSYSSRWLGLGWNNEGFRPNQYVGDIGEAPTPKVTVTITCPNDPPDPPTVTHLDWYPTQPWGMSTTDVYRDFPQEVDAGGLTMDGSASCPPCSQVSHGGYSGDTVWSWNLTSPP